MQEKKRGMCGVPLVVWIISSVILTVIFSLINETGQSMASIIVTSCVIGAMIGLAAFCIDMIIGTSRNKKIARQQAQSDRMSGISRYSSIIYVGGLGAPENIKCDVVLSPVELKLLCGGNEFALPIDKIRNVDFQLDIDEKQYLKTSTAKGAIGAAAFGVSGAVIGLAPKTKTKREVKCYAIISFDGTDGEYKTIVLRDAVPNIQMCSRLVDTLRPMINQHVNKVQL